jgi:hypothetical protein
MSQLGCRLGHDLSTDGNLSRSALASRRGSREWSHNSDLPGYCKTKGQENVSASCGAFRTRSNI